MLVYLALFILSTGSTVGYSDDVLMDGDVLFGGLFPIQDYKDGSCEEVLSSSMQAYEAIRWFFRELNKRNYIQNVSLGFHAFKTCGQAPLAVKATIDMLEKWNNRSTVFGLIGPGRSSETQSVSRLLSSLPDDDRLPEIVYSATAVSLTDKSIYKNLYRVIVPDGIQVEIMLQLLISLKWNYIAIVYDADAYGSEAANTLKQKAEKQGICIPVFTAIASSGDQRIQIEAIGNKLDTSQSPVIGLVFIGQAKSAKSIFKYLNIDFRHFQIIVSESIQQNTDYVKDGDIVYPRAKGLLTSSPPQYDMENFRHYWEEIHKNATLMKDAITNNDWLLQYMKKETGCELTEDTIPQNCIQTSSVQIQNSKMSLYVSYALMAAATFAKTYKNLRDKHCPQMNFPCDLKAPGNYDTFLSEMDSIAIDPKQDFPELAGFELGFSFKDGEILYKQAANHSKYNVYNYQRCSDSEFCFVQVGNYTVGHLSLILGNIKSYGKTGDALSAAVEAECQKGYSCTDCHRESIDGDVLFIPGDYYVVGLVPIHNRGPNPYTCGDLRTAISVDIAEGISYAIKEANSKRDPFHKILGDKTVGLVLMDTCNTPFLTKERVTKFMRGDLKINHNLNSSSIKDKVIGFVGPYASSTSVPLSSLMTDIDKLYIGIASTSSRLSDRTSFPNFMRACSPDSKQADVIMSIADALGSKYVQIFHTTEEYGIAGKESLKAAAKKYRVCIAQSIPLTQSTDPDDYLGYAAELRKFRHAKVVIIFVRSHVAPLLLRALNADIAPEEFVFIGGESWGKRTAVLRGNDKLRGSLTLAQELPSNQNFETYFSDINLQSTENPWLQEYLELKYTCYYPMSFNKKTDNQQSPQCPSTLLSDITEFDTWVPFAINAVSALIIGFNKTIATTCIGCSEYTTGDLIKNVKNVRLGIYDVRSKERVFDENGDGIVGYIISHVVRDVEVGKDLFYKKVGSTENGAMFSVSNLDSAHRVNYSSDCGNEIECKECNLQIGETGRLNETERQSCQQKFTNSSAFIGLAVALGILVLLVVVLLVVLIRCSRKEKPAKEPDYLTVVPDDCSTHYARPVYRQGNDNPTLQETFIN